MRASAHARRSTLGAKFCLCLRNDIRDLLESIEDVRYQTCVRYRLIEIDFDVPASEMSLFVAE